MRPSLSPSVTVLVLLSSLWITPSVAGDEPLDLKTGSVAQLTAWHVSELGMPLSLPPVELSDRLIGDRHPDLFGAGFVAADAPWQPPIRGSLIYETTRNLLRKQILNDQDFGTRGYFKGICGQKESRSCAADQPVLLPVSLGGFDLCLVDPMLDAPLLPPAPGLAIKSSQAICPQNILRTHHELLVWPQWSFGDPALDPSEGGVRASFGWDTFSPRNHQFLTLQVTANIDAGGEKGCLLQICWQRCPRSP